MMTYKGIGLRKYIFDNGGTAGMCSKIYSAIHRREGELSVEEIVDHYISGKAIPRKKRDASSYNTSGLKGVKFERKYSYRGEPLWKVLRGNDYFSCIRYIKRHENVPSEKIVDAFIRNGRNGVYDMFRRETKYGFDRLMIGGKPVSEILSDKQYVKFCGHMKRNPGSDYKKVVSMILSGAKHIISRRMWRGIPLNIVLNGKKKDVVRVTHYCMYHKCSLDDAMQYLSNKFEWSFDANNIRKCH